jgi:hypothetical protein
MRDEDYILDICDVVLERRALRQHCFSFLVGDTGRPLPVDAFYPDLKLVIEYRERQHSEAVPFFDKKVTVSGGISRGAQRVLYDQRRRDVLPKNGITLVELCYSEFLCGPRKRLKRIQEQDIAVIRDRLRQFASDRSIGEVPTMHVAAKASNGQKAPRVDGQITGLAGELFVAAELLKRGLQTSVTFGNAKAIDLLAFNPSTERTFSVQVKAVRKPNVFPIAHARVSPLHVYVFVVLNKPEERVQYYVVPGSVLFHEPDRFSKWFRDPKFPGINVKLLKDFENCWEIFQQQA